MQTESNVKPKELEIHRIHNGQAHIYYRTNIQPEQRTDEMSGETYTMWVYDEAEYAIPTSHASKAELLEAIKTNSSLRSKVATMAEKLGVEAGVADDVSNWTRANEVTASTHWAVVNAFHPNQAKPLNVTRTWCGHEVELDCYVGQSVKDAYSAGNLSVGDYVLVDFVEGDLDKPLAVQKIYKSW